MHVPERDDGEGDASHQEETSHDQDDDVAVGGNEDALDSHALIALLLNVQLLDQGGCSGWAGSRNEVIKPEASI